MTGMAAIADADLPARPNRSNLNPATGAVIPCSDSIVLSVASGSTTPTVSEIPVDTNITGPASGFQLVLAGPDGKTGGSDPAESALLRFSPRQAMMTLAIAINDNNPAGRAIIGVICPTSVPTSRVRSGWYVTVRI